MNTEKKENYVIVKHEKGSLTDFITAFTKHHENIENENVVVDLSANNKLKADDLLGFLEISNLYRNHNKSFVIINNSVSIDDLPEDLIVVPTEKEAEDMIQMDEIQRELGF